MTAVLPNSGHRIVRDPIVRLLFPIFSIENYLKKTCNFCNMPPSSPTPKQNLPNTLNNLTLVTVVQRTFDYDKLKPSEKCPKENQTHNHLMRASTPQPSPPLTETEHATKPR